MERTHHAQPERLGERQTGRCGGVEKSIRTGKSGCFGGDDMTSLQFILMLEAFENFKGKAEAAEFHDDRIEGLEDHIYQENPIPQPKKMEV